MLPIKFHNSFTSYEIQIIFLFCSSEHNNMKKTISLLCGSVICVSLLVAQPKSINNAIIKAKTEMTFPENGGMAIAVGPGGGGDGAAMTMPSSMETTSTTYYTPDFMKTESQSDFGNNVTIVDRKNKKSTTLMEIMGKKMGFASTDVENEAMMAQMDSMRQLKKDTLQAMGITFKENTPELIYSEETKKISGYVCKKVTLKSKGKNGEVNETVIWYNPDFKIASESTKPGSKSGFGGRGGMMSMMSTPGMELIEGFPMDYEISRDNGFKIHMTVLKVELEASIDEKIFEIPKGYDIKPMGSMMGGKGFSMKIESVEH
jgi:hypothetical protein